ncbi:MAG: ABC transporter substrate-binding protein [Spirochaetaceae bacterium]|jgi:NitT/TauT family transport system substrate-binding protein|nr:ABC transporter substrate-binding protein [Spirochaetaceae bacterium]
MKKTILLGILVCAALLNVHGRGQSQKSSATAEDENYVVKIGRGVSVGLCSSPFIIAEALKYYEAEGLKWESITMETGTSNLLLTNGTVDVTNNLLATLIQPIANGLEVKIPLGIHTGCQKVLVRADSNIKKPADLKGKKIGTSGMATSSTVITQRYLAELGIGVTAENLEVEWVIYQSADLPLALERGQVDAIALGDPTAYITEQETGARVIINQATDDYLKDEFCCVVVASTGFIKDHPKAAAKFVRAIQRAAAFVQENPDETARILEEGKYVAGDPAVNAAILRTYNFKASVSEARVAISRNTRDLQRINLVEKDVDGDRLTNQVFVALDGVPDSLYK